MDIISNVLERPSFAFIHSLPGLLSLFLCS
uniref:Uncharacterized protein n=1 Tax=Arundo donax TaxID=35708 RepID=A0A0A8ZNK2_ARUDO